MGVAVGRLDLENTIADLQDRNVERAAAQIEDRDFFVFLLIEAIRQRSGGRFVDNAEDLQSGNLAGVFGGLPLGIVEVRGNGDHRLGDLFPEIGLGVRFEFAENEGGNLLRSKLLHLIADLYLNVRIAVFPFNDFEGHVFRLVTNFGKLAANEAL